jgi:aminoglycoside 6'-N-acetyltransferase I
MRRALWPRCTESDHAVDMKAACSGTKLTAFVANDEDGQALGFIEASLRTDCVNGTTTSPVGFIEGIYVVPQARQRGIARALVQAAEAWARGEGCSEMASDARIDNSGAHAMHRALGFVETSRVVYFRKDLEVKRQP